MYKFVEIIRFDIVECSMSQMYTVYGRICLELTFAGDSNAKNVIAFLQSPGWRLSTGHSAK